MAIRFDDPWTTTDYLTGGMTGGGTWGARRQQEFIKDPIGGTKQIGGILFDPSKDMSSWDRMESKVRDAIAGMPGYQSAYSEQYLPNEMAAIEQMRQSQFDDLQGSYNPWNAINQLQMSGGADQGARERATYGATQGKQIAQQQLGRDIAGEQIAARQRDFGLKAQDIAARNAYELSAWEKKMQAEGGLQQARQQAEQAAKPKGFFNQVGQTLFG
jgi:hypothetical protein